MESLQRRQVEESVRAQQKQRKRNKRGLLEYWGPCPRCEARLIIGSPLPAPFMILQELLGRIISQFVDLLSHPLATGERAVFLLKPRAT